MIDDYWVLVALIVGILASYLIKEAYLERKISRLEDENEDMDDEIMSLRNTLKGREGVEVKADKAKRQQQAMLEFAMAMKEGKPMAEVMQELAGKYPDIAMDLAKKGLKL